MQEAHEKCNEIKIKTENDFTLEKQNLVHNGKLKIQEEYAQKEKNLEIQQRVDKSDKIGKARVEKMKVRDDLLEKLKKSVTEKLAVYSSSPQYPTLIKNLIVQGLIKIQEQTVEIQCRPDDKAAVTRVLPDALNEFRTVMQNNGYKVNPKVTISKTPIGAKGCSGGIILTALDGKIVLNQTTDERLSIAYKGVMPSVRFGLFQSSA